MTTIGYARTSTAEQVAGLADQIAALERAGCERIFQEHASAMGKRPELNACLDYLREGDVFVITKPDRLARSVIDMMDLIDRLKTKKVTVRILSLGVDTSTPTGGLMLTLLAGVAQWEREIMLERQRAGIAQAKAEGKYKGRKPTMTEEKVTEAILLRAQGQSVASIARYMGVDTSNVWRALAKRKRAAIERIKETHLG